jgi:hypothetical protein
MGADSHLGIRIPFIFSTPVWGTGHTGLFLNVGLPSLLAPGNLSGLTANPDNRYLIYTHPAYEKDIRAAFSYQRLARILAVEIIPIREAIVIPHRTMSDCHIDSLRRAEEVGAAAVFLPPDCVWSNGSMVRLEALTQSGKSVVHVPESGLIAMELFRSLPAVTLKVAPYCLSSRAIWWPWGCVTCIRSLAAIFSMSMKAG